MSVDALPERSADDSAFAPPKESVKRAIAVRFMQSGSGPVGLAVLAVFTVMALFARLLAQSPPGAVSPNILLPPSSAHWLGTNNVGQDILANILHGARISLLVGIAVAVTVLVLGSVVGSVAGYFGGWTDSVLMRLSELFQVMPGFILAIVMVSLLGQQTWLIVLALSVAIWPRTARIIRAQVLSLKEREFVEAARAAGFPDRHIIFREVLPNAMPPAIVQMTLDIGRAMLLQAGLAFLGLGDPNVTSWGQMLQQAQPYLGTAWWMSVFPGLAIFLAVLAFNLIGDGLNDSLDPQQRRS